MHHLRLSYKTIIVTTVQKSIVSHKKELKKETPVPELLVQAFLDLRLFYSPFPNDETTSISHF